MNKQILYGLYMFVLIYCTVAKILSKSFKNNAYVIYLSPIAVGIFVSLILCYIYKEKIQSHIVDTSKFCVYYVLISAICILSLYGVEVSGNSFIFGDDDTISEHIIAYVVNGLIIASFIMSIFMWKNSKQILKEKKGSLKSIRPLKDPDHLIEIPYQVAFMLIFLVIFYFSYVHNVEKKSFDKQISMTTNNVYNTIDSSNSSKGNNTRLALLCAIQHQKYTTVTSNDTSTENHNNSLLFKSFDMVLYLLIIISILYSIIRPNISHISHLTIIIKQIVIMVVVIAITEIIFLKLIIGNYHSINSNKVTCKLYKLILEHLKCISCDNKGVCTHTAKCGNVGLCTQCENILS